MIASARVAPRLLELAEAAGRRSIAVVGTGKNAGKTVVVRALCESLHARGVAYGLTSIGRDGEAVDAADALAKPRLFLYPGALLATAREVLPAAPAPEVRDLSALRTAAGPLVYVAVREPGFYEIAGAPTASGVRASIERMYELGAQFAILDGAVDRVAALGGSAHAIVVAAGASGSATPAEAAAEARSLVERLRVPAWDPAQSAVHVEGALGAVEVRAFLAAREERQIVVTDPTQIAVRGTALPGALQRLKIRCKRPLHVIAVTVASIGRERYFEPAAFMREVAAATKLPVFDVYAGKEAAA